MVQQYAKYLPLLSGATDPYAGYLAFDTFTRSDGVLLNGATPEKGPNWSALTAADFTHDTGKVKFSAGGGEFFAVDVLSLGVADVTLTADLAFGGGGNGLGLCFNVQDANNLWMAWVNPAAETVYIFERVTGGFTVMASTFKSMAAGGAFALSVTAQGDNITADFGGTPLNYSVGGRAFKTNTLHGVMMFSLDSSPRIDNFGAAAA